MNCICGHPEVLHDYAGCYLKAGIPTCACVEYRAVQPNDAIVGEGERVWKHASNAEFSAHLASMNEEPTEAAVGESGSAEQPVEEAVVTELRDVIRRAHRRIHGGSRGCLCVYCENRPLDPSPQPQKEACPKCGHSLHDGLKCVAHAAPGDRAWTFCGCDLRYTVQQQEEDRGLRWRIMLICRQVESDFGAGGLSAGIYLDFAVEVAMRALRDDGPQPQKNPHSPDSAVVHATAEERRALGVAAAFWTNTGVDADVAKALRSLYTRLTTGQPGGGA